MKMNRSSLQNQSEWAAAKVRLPAFDMATMTAKSQEAPIWVHFGAGNIFRAYIAVLQQRLLESGEADRGILAAETFDDEIIDRIFTPFDNLTLSVVMNADASIDSEIVASISETLKLGGEDAGQWARLKAVFESPSLQMASFTITEKGYALHRADGALFPIVEQDMAQGPAHAKHVMSVVAAAMHARYLAGAQPFALVSMDNCSHNGEKLQQSVLAVANAWRQHGFVEQGFIDYLSDAGRVAFPWSMIDKITPRPDPAVQKMLTDAGIEDMAPIVTGKDTYIAPFVNAERPQYLVIEDTFPNGRPALEKAGVYLTDRETVNKTERMKVTTCLNPLHTAMSIYGCLLGIDRVSDEMKDADILALITRLGYTEGLPVVTDPGILSPRAFIDEVVQQRLPNPFMPDTAARIVTDTSQKVGIRFGETIKSYIAQGLDLDTLMSIPLALAGWLRYMLAVDDSGKDIVLSPDPMNEELQAQLATIRWDDPASLHGQLDSILSNALIFGVDLTQTTLAARIEGYFKEMLAGAGSVRTTLHKHLA